MSNLHVSCLVRLPAAHLLLSWDTSLDAGSFRARLTKFREGSRCLFSSTLEFHGKYLNKHSLVSLSLSEAFYVLSWDVKYVVSCITVCSSAVMWSYGGRTFIKHVFKLENWEKMGKYCSKVNGNLIINYANFEHEYLCPKARPLVRHT